jgi:radical SAM superfamily enzyme YgiQ (UPF0313 family)
VLYGALAGYFIVFFGIKTFGTMKTTSKFASFTSQLGAFLAIIIIIIIEHTLLSRINALPKTKQVH